MTVSRRNFLIGVSALALSKSLPEAAIEKFNADSLSWEASSSHLDRIVINLWSDEIPSHPNCRWVLL